ncbi:hypothetical protein [Caballeronia sp. AZ7_KS35]|uniref:hypothetical protein n=1 Tax=Caballeronia sp. AZ7_KS35 TaxID=2921762 RepID=UPI002028C2CC|nr:hypothetical protein [Caballeronia sp. AZ7_KS35]
MRFSAVILACVLLFTAYPVQATNATPNQPNEPATKNAASAPEIVIDKEHGVIRFMVDGKEVATLNKDGLLVRGNVAYSGELTDVESSHAK